MNYVTVATEKGVELRSTRWPLSADAWEDQMMFLVARGCRCIAHNRPGHSRSSVCPHRFKKDNNS